MPRSERPTEPPPVERILVTGADAALDEFHLMTLLWVNPIERRGRTVFYTVAGVDLPLVLEQARAARVTVQRRVEGDLPPGSPPEAYWPVEVRGDAEPWRPDAD
jgi:hypothetical protein